MAAPNFDSTPSTGIALAPSRQPISRAMTTRWCSYFVSPPTLVGPDHRCTSLLLMSKKDSHATKNITMSEEDLNDSAPAKRQRRFLTPRQLRRSLVSTTSAVATSWSSLIKVATSCKSGNIRRFGVGYASRSSGCSSATGTDSNHYPTATRSFANFCLSLGLAGGATMAATLISMDLVLPKTRIMTENPVFVYILWMFLFAEVARVATTATARRPLVVVPVMLPGDVEDDTLSCTSNDESDRDNHWLL